MQNANGKAWHGDGSRSRRNDAASTIRFATRAAAITLTAHTSPFANSFLLSYSYACTIPTDRIHACNFKQNQSITLPVLRRHCSPPRESVLTPMTLTASHHRSVPTAAPSWTRQTVVALFAATPSSFFRTVLTSRSTCSSTHSLSCATASKSDHLRPVFSRAVCVVTCRGCSLAHLLIFRTALWLRRCVALGARRN